MGEPPLGMQAQCITHAQSEVGTRGNVIHVAVSVCCAVLVKRSVCDLLVYLMATDLSANPPEYLTRADLPELVKSVSEAQLRPPPAAEGSSPGPSSSGAGEQAKY